MTADLTPKEIVEKLAYIAKTSPTDAMDEALRLGIWMPGTAWHHEDTLYYCAQLAVDLNEHRLAGLAAYRAQRLYLDAQNQPGMPALPQLPGLEVAARRFNLIRYTPVFSRNIQLRRPCLADREFLLNLFLDPDFARYYSRPTIGHEESRVHSLIKGDQRCPLQSDPWAWIISDTQGSPMGLIELNDMDFYQQSADFSMGFNAPQFSTMAAEALCLGLSIAYYHLSLKRVTHHIYGDHPLMHKIHQRMGSVKEYTLDGLVSDPQTGAPASMTIYSMTIEEARDSAWLKQVQRFCPSLPDLLEDQIEKVAEDILTLGPRWEIFPPRVLPEIPEPPAPPARPDLLTEKMPIPPLHIKGQTIRLRPPTDKDRATILDWIHCPGFIQTYPNAHIAEMDIDKLTERLGHTPGKIMLWLVETKPRNQSIGLTGVEFINDLPILFILTGFTSDTDLQKIAESWQLLRNALLQCYPKARTYLKVPEDSPLHRMIEKQHDGFHFCGVERYQRHITGEGQTNLVVLEIVGSSAPP